MIAVYTFAGILLLLIVVVVSSAVRERGLPSRDAEDLSPAERRDAALEKLREVEFDYQTGKLVEEDYHRLRRRYGRLAVRARAEAENPVRAGRPGDAERAAREDGPEGETPDGERAGPEGVPEGRGPGDCPACGASLDPGDRFCTRCGSVRDA